MKYLVAGLGNIGDEYASTRHNIGFDVLNKLCQQEDVNFSLERYAYRSKFKLKGRTLILIKPTTYMNLSGKAIAYWLQKEKIALEKLLIVTDDIALPVGKLRLKPFGGDGGHNGLSHIIETLRTREFPRLRFGIGNEFEKGEQVDYVLGQWKEKDKQTLESGLQNAILMIKSFATIGIERTMNQMNS